MKIRSRYSSRTLRSSTLAFAITAALVFVVTDTALSAGSGREVARVNGTTIYESDLDYAVEASLTRRLAFLHRDREDDGSAEDLSRRAETLDRLIDIELLYQESLKHRFQGLLEESEERYRSEVNRIGGEDRLAAALKCNEMTPDDFRKAIFRKLSIKRLLDKEVYSRIQVTDDEVKEYYEKNLDRFRKPGSVRLRQILIKVPSNPGEDTWRLLRARAFTIYKNASEGGDFVQLARRHSDDPATANAGGDMGFIQIQNLDDILDTRIRPLEEGTVTEPIRKADGFHIIKIVSNRPSTPKTLEEARNTVITILRRERAREMISKLLDDLRSRADIEILNEP